MPHLYRVIVPVSNIEAAAKFYATVLGAPGRRVSPGRHCFESGGHASTGPLGEIARRPWGEESFYARDPFGNPLCFVSAGSVFRG
jgi:catechol 2,3-dioxygenase-like lactoylglutathione lyase family enzyme